MRLTIGTWIEAESRDVRQCPSYYAADWEVLRTTPGRYDVILQLEGGYLFPMPYWLLVRIDADRVDGKVYSGFGGLNFASNELSHEPKPLTLQMYAYQLGQLIEAGKIELDPEFAGLEVDRIGWAKDRFGVKVTP